MLKFRKTNKAITKMIAGFLDNTSFIGFPMGRSDDSV